MIKMFVRVDTRRGLVAAGIMILATLAVFSGVLKGYLINNSAYLYAFEPWAQHRGVDSGWYNAVLSDDVDAMSVSHPTRELLASGKFAFWNRFWQLGIPEFRIDSGWFYPLRLLWVIFDLPIGMTAEVISRFILGGVFTFLFLEAVGISTLVSIVCALGYAFGSNALGDYMYGFGPISLSLPIAMYAVERLIRHGRPLDICLMVGSLILLNTHIMVHVNALTSFWVGFYATLRLVSEKCPPHIVRKMLISFVGAPLLFAFALLPTLDFYLNYFNDSYRATYSSAQLPAWALLSAFYGKFFGDPLLEPSRYVFGTYVNTGIACGFLAVGLGLWGGVIRLFVKPDRCTAVAMVVVALLLLLIYEFPFEKAEGLLASIPMVRSIKPFYQKSVLPFFLVYVGALGLDYFWRLARSYWIQWVVFLLGVGVINFFVCYRFFAHFTVTGPSPALFNYFCNLTVVHFLLLLGFLIAHPLLSTGIRSRVRSSGIILGSVLMVGLTVYEGKTIADGWIPYSRKTSFYPKTEVTTFLQANIGNSRVVTFDRAAVPGLLYGYGIPVAAGRTLPRPPYLALLRRAYPGLHMDHPTQSLFSLSETDLVNPVWDLIDVRYFVAGKVIDREAIRKKYGDQIRIHTLNDGTILERVGKGRGYVATYSAVPARDVNEMNVLLNDGLDVNQTIIAEEGTLNCSESTANAGEIVVRGFEVGLDSVKAELTTSRAAFFMPSLFLDRGWKAYVNGVEKPFGKGYGFMPVVKLESAGTHVVEFYFFPAGLRYGGVVSLFALFIFLYLLRRESKLKNITA